MSSMTQPHMTNARTAKMITIVRYRPPTKSHTVVGAGVGAGIGSGVGAGSDSGAWPRRRERQRRRRRAQRRRRRLGSAVAASKDRVYTAPASLLPSASQFAPTTSSRVPSLLPTSASELPK